MIHANGLLDFSDGLTLAFSIQESTDCSCVAEPQTFFINTFRFSNEILNKELCQLSSVILVLLLT